MPQMLRTHNLTKVFLMSHPKIRDHVQVSGVAARFFRVCILTYEHTRLFCALYFRTQALFKKAGVGAGQVHHLLPDHVSTQLGGVCNMRLLLMERYIAEQAQAFLGTSRSSISLGVTLSRLADDPVSLSKMLESLL